MKKALIKLHISVFLWGFTGVLGRTINLKEGWLVWWRTFITIVSMWILYAVLKKIEKISWKQFLVVGGIGVILALHWLCFYGSIKYSNVSIALTCLSSSGFVSAIFEPLFFKRKINPKEILIGILNIVGIFIIYFGNIHFSTGIFIGLTAMLFSVTASILNKKTIDKYNPETYTLYQLTGSFVGLCLMMPLYNYFFPTTNIFPQKLDWVWLFVLAWFCTILSFVLYMEALQHVSAFTSNIVLTLEPVYGIILAFFLYKENKELSHFFYIGLLCILLAVVLQTRIITRHSKESTILLE